MLSIPAACDSPHALPTQPDSGDRKGKVDGASLSACREGLQGGSTGISLRGGFRKDPLPVFPPSGEIPWEGPEGLPSPAVR